MSSTTGGSEARRMHRRDFIGMGLRTAGAIAALSAASSLVSACGGGEEKPAATGATPAAPPQPAPAPAAAPPPAPPPAPTEAAGAGGAKPLVTEVAAMAPTVQALKYVSQSAKPDQHCSICMFFTPEPEGGIGKCQLFAQGYVKETGWCSSWTAKPKPATS